MNIRQCYTVLELPMRSPIEEVKLSYKDLVQVWHPDRFTHSPRLQEKAANKLQQLNEAYDTLKKHLERQSQGPYGYGTAGYGTASYGSTGYGAASQAETGPGDGAAVGERATAFHSQARRTSARTATSRSMPSFFESGSSYSWLWQLQAMGVILGLIGLLLLPIGLAVLIAQRPFLIFILMPLPLISYLYRVWVTR